MWDIVLVPGRCCGFLRYTFPPLDAAKSDTLDVKWPTGWIYCRLWTEHGQRSSVVPSSRRVAVRRPHRSAPCWTVPQLSEKRNTTIHFDQICKVPAPVRHMNTLLSSGRLRRSFDLKCNWYQRHFQASPTKTTHCSLDALLFCFLTYVSAVWTEIFITFCLLHLQPLTVDSCGLLSFFMVHFILFFASKKPQKQSRRGPGRNMTSLTGSSPFL